MIRLVIHSSDRKLQSVLAVTLGSEYDVLVEPDQERIKNILAGGQTDVLILDFDSNLGSLDKLLDFLSEVRTFHTPVVVMTDDETRATAMQLVEHGAYDYFRKPPHLLELKLVVRRAHERAQLERELDAAREELHHFSGCDQLIGSSGRMQVVYNLIRRVVDLDAHVLIQGESGTGKELVARAIHNLGERAKLPFVAVSCGAIPETLIEAELFGHEKGAFTGAGAVRAGYFETAGDGTLFLDEIGELSPHTQVKLLRVLQEKEFCRLGSSRPIPLRARLLFATNRYLSEMVEKGTFRQDLYFRIDVLKIEVPPLRERPEDIPTLASHFMRLYADAYRKPVREIRRSAMELLTAYSWPGNVRELENLIQRGVILSETETIGPESLPAMIQDSPHLTVVTSFAGDSFEEQLREYKVRLANKTVLECNGNKTLAARKLSITRAYLHRLLRQGSDEKELAS
ncbi:MAG TPA: sigma-54 dependent transcriptional regulator [Bryobacterales bacterium]|nr:sigma-54 dependent transcriptional regulator [Bryobacterales bacterium]